MTNPDELERAVERLTDLLPRLDACSGYAANSGTPAARQTGKPRDLYWNDHLAADLRLILAANRKMRKALSELCENAELARFHIGNTEGGDIVGSALWDTIGQARSALSTKED